MVEGRVAAVDVRWDEGRTCINTYATVNVERVHKGTAGGSVVVKVPGGIVGEDEVRVEGTAKFTVDEEVFVFLWKDGRGEWLVLGEAQGKFRLRMDEKAGRRMAENSLRGLCLVVRGDPKSAAFAAARRPDSLSCDDLAAVVKASVEAAKAAPAATGSGKETGAAPAGPGTGPADGAPAEGAKDPAAGRDPASPVATPDPPSTTTTKAPGDGAPPPSKDVPAPPAGTSTTPPAGQKTPPEPEPEKK